MYLEKLNPIYNLFRAEVVAKYFFLKLDLSGETSQKHYISQKVERKDT